MRSFNPNEPLIFIHIPKTAGTSVKDVVRAWFGSRCLLHYYDRRKERLPPRRNLETLTAQLGAPPLIYGHFNQRRGFGIEDYYPEVRQFVTILRDPFEMHISRYFFVHSNETHRGHAEIGNASLEQYIREGHCNMLEHFPRSPTMENYRDLIEEFFVDIGCTEELDISLNRIAARLHQPAPSAIPRKNVTARDGTIRDDLREIFRERFPLEYSIYDYVRANQPYRNVQK